MEIKIDIQSQNTTKRNCTTKIKIWSINKNKSKMQFFLSFDSYIINIKAHADGRILLCRGKMWEKPNKIIKAAKANEKCGYVMWMIMWWDMTVLLVLQGKQQNSTSSRLIFSRLMFRVLKYCEIFSFLVTSTSTTLTRRRR